DEAGRADARHTACRPRRKSYQRLLPDRAVGGRVRSAAQHPASEGALLVRHSDRLCEQSPRDPGDREGHPGRESLRGSLCGLEAVTLEQPLIAGQAIAVETYSFWS